MFKLVNTGEQNAIGIIVLVTVNVMAKVLDTVYESSGLEIECSWFCVELILKLPLSLFVK